MAKLLIYKMLFFHLLSQLQFARRVWQPATENVVFRRRFLLSSRSLSLLICFNHHGGCRGTALR